jgi:shikimate kinase
MMGSGKSTVGRRLAALAGGEFIDLDRRIERMYGRSISELFGAGESAFRAREREALVSLLAEPAFAQRPAVVATGGGVVLDPDNVAAMRDAGVVVVLEVPVAVLVERLHADDGRPLLAGGSLQDRLGAILAERAPLYAVAGTAIDAAGPADEVATRVLAVWEAQ